MSKKEKKVKNPGRGKWAVIYVFAFIATFVLGLASRSIIGAFTNQYKVDWSDKIGTMYTDLEYGDKDANKYDLYLPADSSKPAYGLVVYLHPGGFTTGDKSGDIEMLQWLCARGYVAAGINYTLRDEAHPEASVYSQSMEIKHAIPIVVAEAEKRGYHIDEMAMAGGSAGHTLAMLYAYRDADEAPVPVKMVFGAVGPSCFYPEDWGCYGFDRRTAETDKAAAGLFGIMAGKEITADMFDTPAYDEAMKDISAMLWVDDNTVPSLFAYGAYDRVQGFGGSVKLDEALTAHNIPHDYLVFEHSGHGLQNDSAMGKIYYQKIIEYLDTYIPVK